MMDPVPVQLTDMSIADIERALGGGDRVAYVPTGELPTLHDLVDAYRRSRGLPAVFSAPEAGSPSLDKKVTQRRRKSWRRDSEALMTIKKLESEERATRGAASVSRGASLSSCDDEIPLGPCRAPTPAPWRDISDKLKVIMLQRALSEGRGSFAFTLNLGHELWGDALKDPKGLTDFVRRRISRYLKGALGQVVDFWFVVEATHAGRPHLHGAILINIQQLSLAREALRAAAGEVEEEFKRRVLVMKPLHDGEGWARYAGKCLELRRSIVRGSLVATTRPLKARARIVYERERAAALAKRFELSE